MEAKYYGGQMITKKEWQEKLDNLQEWRKQRTDSDKIMHKEIHYDPTVIFNMKFFGGKVLDIGCGETGMASEMPLAEYTGIDPLFENKEKNIIKGIGENLPFEDLAFGTIICLSTLQHCLDYEKLLLEAFRVLEVGGNIYFTVCLDKNVNSLTTYNFTGSWSVLHEIKKYFTIMYNFEHNQVAYIIAIKDTQ